MTEGGSGRGGVGVGEWGSECFIAILPLWKIITEGGGSGRGSGEWGSECFVLNLAPWNITD